MVRMIWCETNEEVQVTLKQLEKEGCKWLSGEVPTTCCMNMMRITIYIRGNALTFASGREEDAMEASKLYRNLLR